MMVPKSIRTNKLLLILVLLCPLNLHAESTHDAIFEVILNTTNHPYFKQAYNNTEQQNLKKVYARNQKQLLWFSSKHPVHIINQVLAYYTEAPEQGLISSDYASHFLREQWRKIQQTNPDFHQFAAFDTALTLTFLRYLNDLHYGRIPPQELGFHLPKKNRIDLTSALYRAIQMNELHLLVKKQEPKLEPYQHLKAALLKYRRLALYFKNPIQFDLERSLNPDEWSIEVGKLHLYLEALNTPIDQPIIVPDKTDNLYTGAIVKQVQNLQAQHGLKNDGIIGKQTLHVLNTPFSQRVEQIEFALERLRWLPELQQGAFILVNIPSFQLWAYDSEQKQSDILNMKVIVGKAINKVNSADDGQDKALQTPVFTAMLSHLVFSPYWNIPESILINEILPLYDKEPDYLERNNMEIVARFTHNAKVFPINDKNIQRLHNGQLFLRQRPGYRNALGHIKFIFPNDYAIYLHDTPALSLFNRTKRDFSHGCIRVEHPNTLAQFVLKNQSQWDANKIKQAMRATKPEIVNLKQHIPVLIFYTTTMASKSSLSFYPDIYHHDSHLKSALNLRSTLFNSRHSPLLAAF